MIMVKYIFRAVLSDYGARNYLVFLSKRKQTRSKTSVIEGGFGRTRICLPAVRSGNV